MRKEKEQKQKDKAARDLARAQKKEKKKEEEMEKAQKAVEINKESIAMIKEKGLDSVSKLTNAELKTLIQYHFWSNKYKDQSLCKPDFVSIVCQLFKSGNIGKPMDEDAVNFDNVLSASSDEEEEIRGSDDKDDVVNISNV